MGPMYTPVHVVIGFSRCSWCGSGCGIRSNTELSPTVAARHKLTFEELTPECWSGVDLVEVREFFTDSS